MKVLNRLTRSAYGMHIADQVAIVSTPLVAKLIFDANPQTIGVLVALQSLAYLIGSLPFGLVVDRIPLNLAVIYASNIALLGFTAASISVLIGNLGWFAFAVFISSFGEVLFVLASLSIIARTNEPDGLSKANSSLELPRAMSAFGVPLTIGFIANDFTAGYLFVVAVLGVGFAMNAARQLPQFQVVKTERVNSLTRMRIGGVFVAKHQILAPIALCSLFWNMAFSMLLVVSVPLFVDVYKIHARTFATALSFFGLAMICGTWTIGRYSALLRPGMVLVAGPASSVVAVVILLLATRNHSVTLVYISFFMVGFGPSMWLIVQNSVRQLVTPEPMLGQVNAVIQTAIYGIRPVGAVLGGAITGFASPVTGLSVVVALFAASFGTALLSRLRSVQTYQELAAVQK